MADKNQPINLSKEDDEVPVALDESTPLPRSNWSNWSSSFNTGLPNRFGRPCVSMPEMRKWPELEGLTAEEAVKTIKEEMPMAVVQVVPQGTAYTLEFRFDRVRIHVDSSNKVIRVPEIG